MLKAQGPDRAVGALLNAQRLRVLEAIVVVAVTTWASSPAA